MTGQLVYAVLTLPLLGATVVLALGDQRPQAQHRAAAAFALAAVLPAVLLLGRSTETAVLRIPLGSSFGDLTFVPSAPGLLLALIATAVGSLTVLFSADYMRRSPQLGRYYALVLLFISAMCGLTLSGSLLGLFVFWELTALCSYALIAFDNDDPAAVAAGVKALIITQIGGVGLLTGVLAAYAGLGDWQIAALLGRAAELPPATLAVIAWGFLLAAVAKSAQFPLHVWLPDAMAAPTPVSALIHAATMVNAGVYLLARFYPVLSAAPGWTTAVVTLGVCSALLGALAACVADDLKRALAYSTISQLGYMVYAVGCGALFAAWFHLLSHAVFKGLLFLAAGAAIHARGTRDLRRLGGLGRQLPAVAWALGIGLAALAGLPPFFNGFWSKELLLETGWAHGPRWAAVAMLLGVGITAFYAARLGRFTLVGAPPVWRVAHRPGVAMRAPLALLSAAVLATWLPIGRLAVWLGDAHVQSAAGLAAQLWRHPLTWSALALTAVGAALWLGRGRLPAAAQALQRPVGFACRTLGRDAVSERAAQRVDQAAALLQRTQTGLLNWNLVGLVVGLILVLLWLARGA